MTLNYPKPELWQKDVIDLLEDLGHQSGAFITVKSARQCGKSWMLNAILLMTALNYPGTNSALVSLTSKNTYKLFKELIEGLEGFQGIKYINKSLYEIEFTNGSSIVFRSASQGSALRGYSLKKNSVLLIDEAAFIPERCFAEILPWSNKNRCPVILVSTPLTKQGTYYQHYVAGRDKQPGFYTIDWSDYDKSKYLPQERIDQYKNLLSPSAFRAEILGEFVDDFERLFKLDQDMWVKAAFLPSPDAYQNIYIGIDWAAGNGGGDYSVITGFDTFGKQILLQYTNSKNPEEQLAWIEDILHNKLDPKKIRCITAETNSLGAVYVSRLRNLCPDLRIEDFVTTNSSKRDIIEYLISRINSGSLRLIDDKEQYNELADFRMSITKSGHITYAGQYEHDDIVMAIAIALSKIQHLEKVGNYAVKSHPNPKYKNLLRVKYGY